MIVVTMPSLESSMTDGVIGRWLKREGERVERDDELVEIETDKVSVTYPAPEAGYLEIVAQEGSVVVVGELIARLGSEPLAPVARELAPAADPEELVPAPSPLPADHAEEPVSLPFPPPAATREAVVAPPPAAAGEEGASAEELRPSPLARRMATLHGLALVSVRGSGPRGRVTRNDVASILGLAPPQPLVPPASAEGAAPARTASVEELSRVQLTVARRMSEAHATVPDFQVETEVAMDRALALRAELKEIGGADPIPSLNDLVVKASALALREHPRANASYQDGRFVLLAKVSVGIAVAAENALLVATIADADRHTLTELAAESARLVERVRLGTLSPAELSPASFTISNLGMFGMTAITPIIDVPQAAILGVGAVRETLAFDERGVVVRRHLMTLRLSCDHRILYGADAARFLSSIRVNLEQPLRLLR